MSVEERITEHGPRVRDRYGIDYYQGWCAGLRASGTTNTGGRQKAQLLEELYDSLTPIPQETA